ncbi:hypothetical protein LUU34_00015100 [Aix galericulata]|nr:hypothetical protein LUU34_00015100 [Aix galericulata]
MFPASPVQTTSVSWITRSQLSPASKVQSIMKNSAAQQQGTFSWPANNTKHEA